jgi:hypothetical protein
MSGMTRTLSAIGAMAVLGCGDATGPNAGQGTVRFTIAAGLPAGGPGLAPETFTLGGNTLVIDRVQIVLREIELERVDDDDCDSSGPGNDCEELEIGPVLVDLPLGGGSARQFEVAVDTGRFKEIEFEIHKPESSGDAAFIQQNPAFAQISIRVTGSYNGAPFTYTSDLDVEQEIEFDQPVEIRGGAATTLTLSVDIRTWFLNEAKTTFVGPSTANKGQPNEGLVKSQIERSFHADED